MLDDELTGIFGPRSHPIVSPSTVQQEQVVQPVPPSTPSVPTPPADVLLDFGLDGDILFDSFAQDLSNFVQGGIADTAAADLAWAWEQP